VTHDGRVQVAGIVRWEAEVNKTQLIDALAERLGDKKIAAAAVEGLVDLVVRTVNGGDKVTITGFGVFEKRTRAARMARNPRTGESVKIKKTSVPAFRPGTLFREVVSGARKLPRVGASTNGAGTARLAAAASPLTTSTALTGPSTTPARTTVAEPPTDVPAAATKTKTNENKTNENKTKTGAKTAMKARKAAAKAAKAAKKESKTASTAPTNAPTTVTARKAVRKSATKK